jgi:large subunit ribosomal protein L4
MSRAPRYDAQGRRTGEVDLPAAFDAVPHTAVLHEAVVWQLAGRRRGTHATKTRGMVSRSTRKMYRQKGTGRARHGGRGAPIFVGGGIAFGPQPRTYAYRLPRQVRRLALRSALAAKVAAGRLGVLDGLALDRPRTSVLAGLAQGIAEAAAPPGRGRILLITAQPDPVVSRSAANLRSLRVRPAGALNVHDILGSEHVLVTAEALDRLTEAMAP